MGVPIETVTVIDRLLAEAGLRTRALRGRGNTPMTYRDAANLIIATALRVQPKDAARTVNEYNALPAMGEAPGATFGDSFTRLLEVFSQDQHALQARADRGLSHAYEIRLVGPKPYAIIQMGDPNSKVKIVEFGTDLNAPLRHQVEFSEWAFMPIVGAITADLSNISSTPPS